jgi:FKBP-type peptidyl-prolyl cis-trans isomerase
MLPLSACGSDSPAAGGRTTTNASDPPPPPKLPAARVPPGPPPKKLVIKDFKVGSGPETKIGDTASVRYTGVAYKTGKQFTKTRAGEAFKSRIGLGGEQPGWEKGLPGMKIGGQRELIIPPRLTLNELGRPETLIYVIELLAIEKPKE